MGVIIFNGRSSEDFGIKVETFPDYTTPEKDYETIHVPGRNGDLIIFNGAFKNVTKSYTISVSSLHSDFYEKMNSWVEWLHSSVGYCRLEDSYEPWHYRLAAFNDSINIENIFNEAGKSVIDFDCKPQKFLKLGDVPVKFLDDGILNNPTKFESDPLIQIKMEKDEPGAFQIGNKNFSLKAQHDMETIEITIDSEIQDVYNNVLNLNHLLVLNNGEFPKLEPGDNYISFTGGIMELTIIPKWWTI